MSEERESLFPAAVCEPTEHDYLPPVVLSANVSAWGRSVTSSSLLSICRKCGKTVERVLNMKERKTEDES